MASLVPSLNSCLHRMQAGEKRFARRLESHLEDDYLCWYELPVGKRQRYTDFIILHPHRGLLLLEVKDWKLDTIQKIDKVTVDLLTSNGLKRVSNPLEQVRQCTYQLLRALEKDPQLVVKNGRYKGKLLFPHGYGVVLTSITRKQFDATDLGEVLPAHQTICKDEMVESIDPEAFQERLWEMFNVQFPQPLALPQIDRIRWHLFPEIRIHTDQQADLFDDSGNDDLDEILPDIMKVMDIQQEQLARSMGDGHRVIHGVAGSGKTLILGYRCLYLAKLLSKPILVLCYNVTLAARLREVMTHKGVEDKVHVYHFHDWCGEQLRTYHVKRPDYGDQYYARMVESVIGGTQNGSIPRGQYGAVMIDEGHDFEPEWLELVVGMVDPESNSFLLLYDDAQSIYTKNNRLDFTLSSVGVQARGRTTILKLNYRNTDEILTFAYKFAQGYFSNEDKGEDHVPLVKPVAAGRRGPRPVIKKFESYEQEARYVTHILRRLHEEKEMPWSDMCVTYPQNWMGKKLASLFREGNVPCQWLSTQADKKGFRLSHDSVKIMTMHSSKGLEFPMVAVSGIGSLPYNDGNSSADAKLLYVAMTRSTEKLLMTSHRSSRFTEELLQIGQGE